jgi:hypothetical protein
MSHIPLHNPRPVTIVSWRGVRECPKSKPRSRWAAPCTHNRRSCGALTPNLPIISLHGSLKPLQEVSITTERLGSSDVLDCGKLESTFFMWMSLHMNFGGLGIMGSCWPRLPWTTRTPLFSVKQSSTKNKNVLVLLRATAQRIEFLRCIRPIGSE